MPYGRHLHADERKRLEAQIKVFIAGKHFEGCGGLEITDEIKVTIAAQACLLLLNLHHNYFERLTSVVVYPESFDFAQEEAGLADGTHVELFFLFREDGSYSMGPPPPDMPKDQFVAVLRQRIRDDNTFGVVHILEAWVYVPKKPNDHTMKQILAGEMAVSDLSRRGTRPRPWSSAMSAGMAPSACGSVRSCGPRTASP